MVKLTNATTQTELVTPSDLTAINSDTSILSGYIDYLLDLSESVNKFIVLNDYTYYVYSENETVKTITYKSLPEALSSQPTFSGEIELVENVLWEKEGDRFRQPYYETDGTISYRYHTLLISNRDLTFNLNGYTISSNLHFVMTVCDKSRVTIKNGNIFIDGYDQYDPNYNTSITYTGYSTANGFHTANEGILRFENVKINMIDNGNERELTECFNFARIGGQNRATNVTIDLSGNVFYAKTKQSIHSNLSCGRSEVYVDENCVFTITNSHHTYNCGFQLSPPENDIFGLKNHQTGLLYAEYKPKLDFNGKLQIISNPDFLTSEAAKTSPSYGTYVTGSRYIGNEQIFGEKTYIYCDNGFCLYNAQENGSITINGGKFVGGNGITMRSGSLYIPAFANPTLIGIHDFKEYPSNDSGGNAGANMLMGSAVVIEYTTIPNSLGYTGSYGELKDIIIESGQFISNNNVSIASYSNNLAKSTRKTKFVKGGFLNKSPTLEVYENVDNIGKNADFDIIADGYGTQTPVMIVKT